ncbi:hypothetical protein PR048_009638 [Dryococelus australis]|uniref:Anaphase-promoting complex subunit 1 n=1 Tax=Dryococelus australis TaxID=614101 RepID=A0ABQ9I0F2_9NEOP|nr:hypothetical protein PR048_009638 [Dryococelus australis]
MGDYYFFSEMLCQESTESLLVSYEFSVYIPPVKCLPLQLKVKMHSRNPVLLWNLMNAEFTLTFIDKHTGVFIRDTTTDPILPAAWICDGFVTGVCTLLVPTASITYSQCRQSSSSGKQCTKISNLPLEELDQLTGIAALLRFPMPELEDEDEEEEISLITSNQGEPGSVPGWVTGFSQAGIVPDDAVGLRVSSGISSFPHPFIPAPLHAHLSPSSALKMLSLRAAQISSLAHLLLSGYLGFKAAMEDEHGDGITANLIDSVGKRRNAKPQCLKEILPCSLAHPLPLVRSPLPALLDPAVGRNLLQAVYVFQSSPLNDCMTTVFTGIILALAQFTQHISLNKACNANGPTALALFDTSRSLVPLLISGCRARTANMLLGSGASLGVCTPVGEGGSGYIHLRQPLEPQHRSWGLNDSGPFVLWRRLRRWLAGDGVYQLAMSAVSWEAAPTFCWALGCGSTIASHLRFGVGWLVAAIIPTTSSSCNRLLGDVHLPPASRSSE